MASQSLERNNALYVIDKIGEFFTSLYFKVLMVLVAITAAIYFVYLFWAMHNNKKQGKVRRF